MQRVDEEVVAVVVAAFNLEHVYSDGSHGSWTIERSGPTLHVSFGIDLHVGAPR